jgi:hypothetical protein
MGMTPEYFSCRASLRGPFPEGSLEEIEPATIMFRDTSQLTTDLDRAPASFSARS